MFDFFVQLSNGPVSHEDDNQDLDALNELQFKLDKKTKELDKVSYLHLSQHYIAVAIFSEWVDMFYCCHETSIQIIEKNTPALFYC